MLRIARSMALLASLATIALWSVLQYANPYGYQGLTQMSAFVGLAMIGLALLGLVAGWQARPYLLVLVSAASFVPVGLYLLGTPGMFRWIGICNLLLLVASGLMLMNRRSRPTHDARR